VGINPTCGNSDGQIKVLVLGGTAPFVFNWSNIPGTNDPQNQTGLPAGTYGLTVTDANGCTASTTVTLIAPPAPTVTATSTPPSCQNPTSGTITLTVTGGSTPYTYDWSHILGNSDPANLTGLSANVYSVVVTAANGCTTSTSVTLTVPNAPQVTETHTNVTCFGGATGSIDLTVTGGTAPYTYDWADVTGTSNTEDRTGLTAGSYSVTVTDANGCSSTSTVVIGQPTAFAASTVLTHVTCNGSSNGAIDLTVSGSTAPYTYDWADVAGTSNTEDRTGLAAGTYCVTITDANGCTTTTCAEVLQPQQLVVNGLVGNTPCNAELGQIKLTVSGGTAPHTYDWAHIPGSNDPESLSNLAAGDYTVTVTDANGCQVRQ
jgi:uncharacterized protein (DUF2141 family)